MRYGYTNKISTEAALSGQNPNSLIKNNSVTKFYKKHTEL